MFMRWFFPLLEKEGWMRRVKRGADGVVSSAKRFGRADHPGASRHPSFSRRGIFAAIVLSLFVVETATAQDASARIKAAQYALGMIRGPQRIDAINTIEYWGIGVNYTYH